MKSRVTYRDRVPIKPIPRADRVFDHYFIDCLGPLFPSEEGSKPKFNYAFVAVDSFSQFPFCVPLKNLTAKMHCVMHCYHCGNLRDVVPMFRQILGRTLPAS